MIHLESNSVKASDSFQILHEGRKDGNILKILFTSKSPKSTFLNFSCLQLANHNWGV